MKGNMFPELQVSQMDKMVRSHDIKLYSKSVSTSKVLMYT